MQKHILTQRLEMNFNISLEDTVQLYSYLKHKMRESTVFNSEYEKLYTRIINKE